MCCSNYFLSYTHFPYRHHVQIETQIDHSDLKLFFLPMGSSKFVYIWSTRLLPKLFPFCFVKPIAEQGSNRSENRLLLQVLIL